MSRLWHLLQLIDMVLFERRTGSLVHGFSTDIMRYSNFV